MPIRETAAGISCTGRTADEVQPSGGRPKREPQAEPKKPRSNDPDPTGSELQAAFEVANEKRLKRFTSEPDTRPIDRRIYSRRSIAHPPPLIGGAVRAIGQRRRSE
jgi:hypothetical protein